MLYARLLDYCVDNQSQNAIAGMFDYFFDCKPELRTTRLAYTAAQTTG